VILSGELQKIVPRPVRKGVSRSFWGVPRKTSSGRKGASHWEARISLKTGPGGWFAKEEDLGDVWTTWTTGLNKQGFFRFWNFSVSRVETASPNFGPSNCPSKRRVTKCLEQPTSLAKGGIFEGGTRVETVKGPPLTIRLLGVLGRGALWHPAVFLGLCRRGAWGRALKYRTPGSVESSKEGIAGVSRLLRWDGRKSTEVWFPPYSSREDLG